MVVVVVPGAEGDDVPPTLLHHRYPWHPTPPRHRLQSCDEPEEDDDGLLLVAVVVVVVLLLLGSVCFVQGQGEGLSGRLVEAAVLLLVAAVEGGAVWR